MLHDGLGAGILVLRAVSRIIRPRLRVLPSGGANSQDGQVAQLVEQRIENPRVGGSIPSLATNKKMT